MKKIIFLVAILMGTVSLNATVKVTTLYSVSVFDAPNGKYVNKYKKYSKVYLTRKYVDNKNKVWYKTSKGWIKYYVKKANKQSIAISKPATTRYSNTRFTKWCSTSGKTKKLLRSKYSKLYVISEYVDSRKRTWYRTKFGCTQAKNIKVKWSKTNISKYVSKKVKKTTSSVKRTFANAVSTNSKDSSFVFLGLGIAGQPINYIKKTNIKEDALDPDGYAISTGFGHSLTKRIFTTFTIEQATYDLAKVTSAGLALDFKLYDGSFTVFTGLLYGYNTLVWDENPFNTTIDNGVTKYVTTYTGYELGFETKINETFDFYSLVQYRKYKITSLSQDTSTRVIFENGGSAIAGLKVRF